MAPPDEELWSVAAAEPAGLEDVPGGDALALAGGEWVEVPADDLALLGEVLRAVLLHRVGGVLVPLDGRDRAEPRLLDAEIESSGA
jgi:hypothetical protein